MRIASYIIWGVWAVLAILAKIFLGVSWWVATSFLWFPLGVVVVLLVGLNLSVDIGKALKIRAAKADPDTCENCIFGRTAKFDPQGKCMGESLDETIKRPHKCKFYQRTNR